MLGEEIFIANNIRVKIVAIKGGRVKLGIIAPDDVEVYRQEIAPPPADQQNPQLKGQE